MSYGSQKRGRAPRGSGGLQPRDGDWLTSIGRGVQEIRIAYSKQAYRVVYVASIGDCIYVLHAFHKKSKAGIATPQQELDIATRRYRELIRGMKQ